MEQKHHIKGAETKLTPTPLLIDLADRRGCGEANIRLGAGNPVAGFVGLYLAGKDCCNGIQVIRLHRLKASPAPGNVAMSPGVNHIYLPVLCSIDWKTFVFHPGHIEWLPVLARSTSCLQSM